MFFVSILSFLKPSTDKDLFDVIVWGITIIGGLYGVINFGINGKAVRKERKIKTFQNRVAQIDRVRPASIKECFDKYKNKYSEIDKNNTLVVKKEWLLPDNKLFDFSKIKVELMDEYNPKDIKFPILRIFPNKKLNYSELLIKYNKEKKYFFNGDIYCTYEIRIEEEKEKKHKIGISVYKSNYYSFVNSCKVLELMNETDEARRRFKLDILNFKNRHTGIGINAITIFNNVLDDHNNLNSYFIIHQRSNTVVECPNSIHVVPAGTYSPMISMPGFEHPHKGETDSHNKDPKNNKNVPTEAESNNSHKKNENDYYNQDLRNTIYREFLEEVWQSKYMKELGSIRFLHENVKYYILKYFTKVYFLGIGVEPYNTKTEILVAMVFNMSGYEDDKIDQIIGGIEEEISPELKEKIKLEAKRLFRKDYRFNDFNTFFDNQKAKSGYDSVSNEGDMHLEQLTKGILEQYYSDINVTPSAKEIFRKISHVIDEIKAVV